MSAKGKPDYMVPEFRPLWIPQPVFLPNGWGVCVQDVGKELAKRMLATNAANQRNLSLSRAVAFSSDMQARQWRMTHQGIAFDRKGKLIDGQTRLKAVIESDTTQQFVVFFGAGGKEEMSKIDMGRNRTAVDAGTVLGMSVDRTYIGTATALLRFAVPHDTSSTRFQTKWTPTTVLNFSERHRANLSNALRYFKPGKLSRVIGKAAVKAACVAALYHHAKGKIERFVGILIDEIPVGGDHESAAKILRTYFTATDQIGRGGIMSQQDHYLRTTWALENFISETPVTRCWSSKTNPFPVDDELADKVKPILPLARVG